MGTAMLLAGCSSAEPVSSSGCGAKVRIKGWNAKFYGSEVVCFLHKCCPDDVPVDAGWIKKYYFFSVPYPIHVSGLCEIQPEKRFQYTKRQCSNRQIIHFFLCYSWIIFSWFSHLYVFSGDVFSTKSTIFFPFSRCLTQPWRMVKVLL
jgi:hypothetical protein